MGKDKQPCEVETPFIPKISEVSRKLALRKTAEEGETKGVPHFMLHTKCKPPRELLDPIFPQPSKKSLELSDPVGAIALDAPKSRRNNEVGDDKEKATLKLKLKNLDALTAMSKNDVISAPVVLDENVFTFHPKVSDTSNRIVESLGTDFMSRQQKHLEKQRKLLNQATSKQNYQTVLTGPLSPISISKSLASRRYSERLDIAQAIYTNDAFFKPRRVSGLSIPVRPLDFPVVNKKKTGPPSDAIVDSGPGPLTLPGTVEESGRPQAPDEGSDEISSSQTAASGSTGQKPALANISQGPSASGVQENQNKRHRSRGYKENLGKSQSAAAETMDAAEDKENDVLGSFAHMRSKTMPSLGRPKIQRKLSTVNDGDRLRLAKEQVEKAIKYKKVFTIQGGYSTIRHLLRKRGWVEKFYKIQPPPKPTPRTKRRKNSDDDDDSDGADDVDDDDDDDADADDSKGDEQPKVPPWEEEDGIYGIMSRMVRNVNPTFIWVLKRDTIDYRYLSKDQIINHYCRAGSFTTKVGLCVNMRNVPWFESADPDTFYPRCYRLSHDEDKSAFIDDYRMSACMSVLKVAVAQMKEVHEQLKREAEAEKAEAEAREADGGACTNPTCTRSRPNSKTGNKCVHAACDQDLAQSEPAGSASATAANAEAGDKEKESATAAEEGKSTSTGKGKGKKKVGVALRVVEFAVAQCEKFLGFRNHEDIDVQEESDEPGEETWDKFLQNYYILAHEGGYIPYVPKDLLSQCETLVNRLKAKCPQFDLDGTRNVWIVKPGAKSRGRGIMCYNKLEEMLKLVSAQVVQKEGKYVVQKYIERPLLIYNTKFDIRQWFLVTDWNPLTLWFYQDSYLRFCSQEFTLDNFDESIHLSNNAIQKHYKNGPRSDRLPVENMWTHVQFQDYLTSRKLGNLWDDVIYPGMKKAVVCSLLATQDVIEYRKSSFELYGADFMLTEDFMPWMIEINSSPSMESSTAITSKLCSAVLEDTLKVVLDRRYDRNCDVGRFELAYKQPLVTVPPYIGISLSVDGQSLRKPAATRAMADTTPRNPPRPSASLEKMVESRKGGGSYSSSASQSAHSGAGGAKETYVVRRSSKTPDSKARFAMQAARSCPEGKGDTDSRTANDQGTLRSGSDGQAQGLHHHRSGEPPNLHPIRSHSPREDRRSQGLSSAGRSADGQDSMYARDPEHLGRYAEGGARLRVPAPPPKTLTTTPGTALQQVASRRIVSRTSVSSNYPVPPSIPDKNAKAPIMSVNNVESTDLQTIKASKGFLNPLIAGAWGRTCNECGNGMNLHLSKLNPKCKCQRDSVIVRFDQVRVKSAAAGLAKKTPSCSSSQLRYPGSASPAQMVGDPNLSGGAKPRRSSAHHLSHAPSKASVCKTFLNYTDGGIPRPGPPSSRHHHQMVVPAYSRVVRSMASLQTVNFKYGPHLPQFINNSVYLDTSQMQNPLSIVPQGYR